MLIRSDALKKILRKTAAWQTQLKKQLECSDKPTFFTRRSDLNIKFVQSLQQITSLNLLDGIDLAFLIYQYESIYNAFYSKNSNETRAILDKFNLAERKKELNDFHSAEVLMNELCLELLNHKAALFEEQSLGTEVKTATIHNQRIRDILFEYQKNPLVRCLNERIFSSLISNKDEFKLRFRIDVLSSEMRRIELDAIVMLLFQNNLPNPGSLVRREIIRHFLNMLIIHEKQLFVELFYNIKNMPVSEKYLMGSFQNMCDWYENQYQESNMDDTLANVDLELELKSILYSMKNTLEYEQSSEEIKNIFKRQIKKLSELYNKLNPLEQGDSLSSISEQRGNIRDVRMKGNPSVDSFKRPALIAWIKRLNGFRDTLLTTFETAEKFLKSNVLPAASSEENALSEEEFIYKLVRHAKGISKNACLLKKASSFEQDRSPLNPSF